MFEGAIGTAMCFIFLFLYFDVRKIAGYAWAVDISLFMLFLWMFNGTHTGMMTGILASVILTGFLRTVRATMGYKVIRMTRRKGSLVPSPRWVHVQARGAS